MSLYGAGVHTETVCFTNEAQQANQGRTFHVLDSQRAVLFARALFAALGCMKTRRSLDEVLQSTSDVLFPAEMGEAVVTVDSRDACGDTPLHMMAWRSNRHAVKLLVESGADINAIGDMSETPLHVAIRKGDKEVVEVLLSAGAATNIRSEFNETALEAAGKAGGEMHKLVKRHAAQQTAARDRVKKRGA